MSIELEKSPIVPVVAIRDAENAVPLAEALLRGGINTIEVTLRTDAAFDAIAAIKKNCPEMIMGIGTVITPDDVKRSCDIGADFLVSPAVSPKLEAALLNCGVLVLPGVATPSEALSRYEAGFEIVKLFPAQAVGGVPLLKSINGPMPFLKFMPTGGVKPDNLMDFYNLPNVVSVGGTWIAPTALIDAGDWDTIEGNVKAALAQISAG